MNKRQAKKKFRKAVCTMPYGRIGDELETCLSQNIFVNAWQPLPEPYKED